MKITKKDVLLYAVTGSSASLYDAVEQALKGGVTCLQLRVKNKSTDEFLKEALSLKPLCASYGVPFIINDSLDIALKSNADGIHIGQSDGSPADIRKILGEDKIIGVTAHNLVEALKAEKEGADYLGVGAAFPTGSKDDANVIKHEVYRQICDAVKIPVVAIGGIDKDNITMLSGSGISGIAVISAVFSQDNIQKAAAELKSLADKMVNL